VPDTSLFWYLYFLIQYDKVVYSGIGLLLCRHRHQQYIDATFKRSLRGSSSRCFLVDIHVPPQWSNRHLLLLLIDKKRKEPKLRPVFGHATAPKSLLFGEFTPSATEKSKHMNACGKPIQP
jgi:hypothetical protein